MTASDIITALIAVYGAVLSTIILVREWKAKRPDIRVEVSLASHQYPSGELSNLKLIVFATNAGEKAVVLSSPGLILPNQNRMWFPETDPEFDVTFPHQLRPEHPCSAWVDPGEVGRALKSDGFSGKVKLIGFYKDAVGRTHKSKPFKFDTDVYA